ncbi:MAG: hypothetical protein RLZZ373_2886 [Pseudomonadota bacterium]|jgi:hypothetical protein
MLTHMESRWGAAAKGFFGAIAAALLIALLMGVLHLWADHTALHQAFGAINALATKHPELFK